MTPEPAPSPIAGAVLPLRRAEELIATLQTVVSARIAAGENGVIEAVHVLTTGELTPKQVVRNIESALMAHLGMKVDHRKISVAATVARPVQTSQSATITPPKSGPTVKGEASVTLNTAAPSLAPTIQATSSLSTRQLYFEDVEIRGSRSKGSLCRVTLRRGDSTWVGEAEGVDSTRTRLELAARAALSAIKHFEGNRRMWDLAGIKRVDAFETEFAFIGIETWVGRERVLLTGTCEIRDSAETSAVLAVLDATNRWLAQQSGMDVSVVERRGRPLA
jgi:hypothetical protein